MLHRIYIINLLRASSADVLDLSLMNYVIVLIDLVLIAFDCLY